MTRDEQLSRMIAFMNDYEFTPVTLGDEPFARERRRVAFAPHTPGNVYTLPETVKVETNAVTENEYIKLTLPKDIAAKLDNKRGGVSRAEYIRKLLLAALDIDEDPVKRGGDRISEKSK